MTALPPALRPWASALELLDGAVQGGLSTWLAPLRSLFGPMAPPRQAADGAPDGYDGITRRGSYDRLLLSEWAVALEVPEEFLRRAVMREHVFTRPAFAAPQTSTRAVALLDVGPRQLGAPRLAQLAALIVLESRAVAQGGSFGFGSLQHPDARLRSVSRNSLSSWTDRISWSDAPTDPEATRARLDEDGANECWLIGGPNLRALAEHLEANLLAVEDIHTRDERALQLTAHRRGRVSASVRLPLPPADVCTRTLRSPLARATPVRRAKDVRPNSLGTLSLDGRRLLFRDGEGGITAHHVPNTMNEPPGGPKRVHPGNGGRDVLLGADMYNRIIALSRRQDGQLTLRGSGLEGHRSISVEFVLEVEVPPSLQTASSVQLMVCSADDTSFAAWILDDQEQLWRLSVVLPSPGNPDGQRSLVCVERACRDLVRLSRHRIAWRSLSQNCFLSSDSKLDLGDVDVEHAVFGIRGGTDFISVAWVDGDSVEFRPALHQPTPSMAVPDGDMLGLSLPSVVTSRPRVVFVREQRHVYRRTGTASDGLLFTAPSRIEEIRFEPSSERVHWRAEDGTLGVYCLERGEVVLRLDLAPSEVPA